MKLSDFLLIRHIELVDGGILYDPRRPESPPIWLNGINARLDFTPAGESSSPGLYAIATATNQFWRQRRFYQRLLAGDQAEAWELAEEKLRNSSLAELYDTLMIPALILAEEDRHRDELDPARAKYMFQSIRDLLQDLAERPMVMQELIVPEGKAAVTARVSVGVEDDVASDNAVADVPTQADLRILCIPAHDEADEMCAIMLAHLLVQHGLKTEVISFKTLAGERLEVVQSREADLVGSAATSSHVRRLYV